MTRARMLLNELQEEMFKIIRAKPSITKAEIEAKMGLESLANSEGGAVWSDEFYAIMYQLEKKGRIYRVSRGRFKVMEVKHESN